MDDSRIYFNCTSARMRVCEADLVVIMENIITGCRILCSIILLVVPVFSPQFYFLYLVAGFTDMIDGTIARKTNTASEFGARLDTVADTVFVLACMIKILPVLSAPAWLYICVAVIAAIKLHTIISGYVVQRSFVSKHTIMNKFTGAVLFALPLTLPVIDIKYSGAFTCAIALIAAVQEGYLVWVDNRDLSVH